MEKEEKEENRNVQQPFPRTEKTCLPHAAKRRQDQMFLRYKHRIFHPHWDHLSLFAPKSSLTKREA
jgi:hypothetical protein